MSPIEISPATTHAPQQDAPPRPQRWTRLVRVSTATLAAATIATAGLVVATAQQTPTTTAPVSLAVNDLVASPTESLATLDTLPVKGRAPKTGYARTEFGQAWSDDVTVAGGRNGCDTRNDILDRDLTNKTYKAGTRDCVVLTGTLADPYTGTTINFTRGAQTSSDVQIDHVVALADAWQKGAQQLSAERRRDLANDPRNLQATDGPTNQKKGAGDAATWLPSNKSYRCTYVSRQIAVKAEYKLWVTAAERDAMTRVLTNCNGDDAPTSAPAPAPAPAPTTTPKSRPQPSAPAPSSTYYANCSAARAAGAAPLYAGQPGYRSQLDGDKDGVACE